MRKGISYLLSIIIVSLCFTGCGNGKSNASNGKGIKILFSYTEEDDNSFRDTLSENAKSYADSVGAILDVQDPEGSIENQVEQFKSAKEKGYSAIICIPENVDTARQLMAAADDLPIIFVNKSPDESVLEEDKYIYVGSNEEVAGKYQAEYILEKFASKSEINIALLKGEKGHSATIGRTNSFIEVLNNSDKKVNIIFNDFADFSTDGAQSQFNVFLSTGQEVDVIACNNDAMSIGVINALRENGIEPSNIPVLGVDATSAGCKAIVDGDMVFTVYQSAAGQGEYTARVAIALATSGTIKDLEYVDEDGKHIWIPFEKVDSSNAKEYMN